MNGWDLVFIVVLIGPAGMGGYLLGHLHGQSVAYRDVNQLLKNAGTEPAPSQGTQSLSLAIISGRSLTPQSTHRNTVSSHENSTGKVRS